ncbi:hypothetical protein EVAR_93816_1 [Eumeta japonica]|uniref:Uncharacterized protein n=1 Tax=Eumeta variegata TaxID=151549 RepID=A0A4C1VBX2_EUMVA|nr:hypothetical protein EVAR_93816_1 [Eumeta japonica]
MSEHGTLKYSPGIWCPKKSLGAPSSPTTLLCRVNPDGFQRLFAPLAPLCLLTASDGAVKAYTPCARAHELPITGVGHVTSSVEGVTCLTPRSRYDDTVRFAIQAPYQSFNHPHTSGIPSRDLLIPHSWQTLLAPFIDVDHSTRLPRRPILGRLLAVTLVHDLVQCVAALTVELWRYRSLRDKTNEVSRTKASLNPLSVCVAKKNTFNSNFPKKQ